MRVCVVACVLSDASSGGLLVATGGITLHLRHSLKSPLGSVEETASWLASHKLADIRVSPSIGHLVAQGVDPATAASDVQVCCQHFGGGGHTRCPSLLSRTMAVAVAVLMRTEVLRHCVC